MAITALPQQSTVVTSSENRSTRLAGRTISRFLPGSPCDRSPDCPALFDHPPQLARPRFAGIRRRRLALLSPDWSARRRRPLLELLPAARRRPHLRLSGHGKLYPARPIGPDLSAAGHADPAGWFSRDDESA